MASARVGAYHCLVFVCILCLLNCSWCDDTEPSELKACKFDAIYQFGDSLSDTGNSIVEIPPAFQGRFPYGKTMGKATGRPSDGLLMTDYHSISAGLPYTQPYENSSSTFPGGPNFAVAGVTALSNEVLETMNLGTKWTNSSLHVQLGWFEDYLKTKVCPDVSECPEKLKSSLFIIGSLGSNDHSLGVGKNWTIPEIKDKLVPKVVNALKDGVLKVISYGARRVVVPGTYPMGCSPSYLERQSKNPSITFDDRGCIETFNELFRYHNDQVKNMVGELNKQHPNVDIAYENLYDAFITIFDNLSKYGFSEFKIACCGGGPNRAGGNSMDEMCGAAGIYVCPKPSDYVYFDGGHPTQAANEIVAKVLIEDILPQLHCN